VELQRLNLLDEATARAQLKSCCASEAWADRMLGHRPYPDEATVLRLAREEWASTSDADRLEAFAAHPRIGEGAEGEGDHARWSRQEQEQAETASAEVRGALADCNRRYEEKFGHVYLVFATGKSAEQMLELCRDRLANAPEVELSIAAAEQAQITDLRLRRLLGIG
jgi:OHCU decarboxylase